MKKSLLLLVAGAISLSAGAQNANRATIATYGSTAESAKKTGVNAVSAHKNASARLHSAERTTNYTCDINENFASGTSTTLPTGWTAGITTGPGTWHWTATASSGSIALPALMSTTASDGWMIFNSDSLAGGTGMGTVVPAGWLQSPSYNCSALATVVLTFQELYAKFQDSAWVEVSSAGASGPFTTYRIPVNDALNDNEITVNPQIIHLDITTAAALKPSVYIRFVYSGPPGGGYSWNIDDICIGPKNADDVGLEKSFVYLPTCTPTTGSEESSLYTTPLQVVDSIFPVTFLSNFGANSEATVALTANIYYEPTGGSSYSSVYTSPYTYTSLVPDAADSLVQFSAGFKPTATGNYFAAINATVTGDGDLTNNNDSVGFSVTDTLWENNSYLPSPTQGYIVHSPASGSTAERSFEWGMRFDVPCTYTANDTISGFQCAFSSQSVPTNSGGTVIVQLYSGDKTVTESGTGWTYVGSSIARSVTAPYISTSGSLIWCDFRIDQTGAHTPDVTPFILQAGLSYVAVVQTNGVTTELDITATDAPFASSYAGYFGQLQTGNNDGAQNFGTSTTTNLGDIVPVMRMCLGTVHLWPSAVQNINADNSIGEAFPNPSNTEVTVPFTMAQDTKVTVTLTNIMGQTIGTQNVNVVGGQANKAVFNTSGLAGGLYMYTVQANGVNTTGRVVVAH